MVEDLLNWLASDNGIYVHWAIFMSLVLSSLGFPIPEDIPLLLGGVAFAKNVVGCSVYLTSYTGVILGDLVIYWIGYLFGERLLRAGTESSFLPAITQERVDSFREHWRRQRLVYVLAARHLFPIRGVTFLSAGALRVPFMEFLIADLLAALVSVSIMVSLGYYIGGHLTPEVTDHLLRKAHLYLGGLTLLALIFVVFRKKIFRIFSRVTNL